MQSTSTINKDNFFKIINQFDFEQIDFINKVVSLYNNFFLRSCFVANNNDNDVNYSLRDKDVTLKAGLEFETGNIASSFRAISKLNELYDKKHIDIGLFITSINKYVSTNIWPSSNRNGSIEELKNRKFLNQIKFPLILIGFEPDVWDANAMYLKKDGTRYTFGEHTEIKTIAGRQYYYYQDQDVYQLIENNQ